MKKLENFLAHTGFLTKKISNGFAPLENKKNYTRKVFCFLCFLFFLITNPESSSLNRYPWSTFKGEVPQEYFATPPQSDIFLETYAEFG